jgi:hypothetical protein
VATYLHLDFLVPRGAFRIERIQELISRCKAFDIYYHPNTAFIRWTIKRDEILKIWNGEQENMAKKTSQSDLFKVDFGETYFTTIELAEADLTKYDAWYVENEADYPEYLNQLMAQGDKLSLAYDLYNDCITATLTIRNKKSAAHGAVISARSDNAYDALCLVVYKRMVLLDEENPQTRKGNTRRG